MWQRVGVVSPHRNALLPSLLAAACLVLGCAPKDQSASRSARGYAASPSADSLHEALPGPIDSARATPPQVSGSVYVLRPLRRSRDFLALERQLGTPRLDQVLRLNRVDRGHVHDRDTLVVPEAAAWDSLAPDWNLLTPFPRGLAPAGSIARLLIVSARIQAWAAYDSGHMVRWGTASTGRREKPTPPGLYHTNWKQPERRSTFNDEWLLKWYVNLDSRLGISLHVYELPGRPASHSCVRLLEDDAKWLYDWAEGWRVDPADQRHVLRQGTPVVVMDAYDFDAPRPWRALAADPHANDIPADSIAAAMRRWRLLAAAAPSADLAPPARPAPAESARTHAAAP